MMAIQVMFQTKPVCVKCVLPESPPDIRLDPSGVCNICRDFEKSRGSSGSGELLESEFIKTLNRHKSKGVYDCLVMCSGGKDSTAALYYMKTRYRKNPLAFTFDHGFETEDALENVRNAVDILGVDHLLFRSDLMKPMFAEIVKNRTKVVLCHVCSIWYMQVTFDIAARFDIPVIIAGWTKGQGAAQPLVCDQQQREFASMARETGAFIREYSQKDPHYGDLPHSMEEVIGRASRRHKSVVLSPHWFLPTDPSVYVEQIKKELKWKFPRVSYPGASTNCYLNFLSVYNSMKHYGYTHYHVEMSKLVRASLLTREEALKLLEINFDEGLLRSIMEKLGLNGLPGEAP